jgi:hypothetical protein
MMRAWFEDVLKSNVETTIDFYTSALEVLKWGAELWKDVPFEDKGPVFQPTFIRGVKCLRLEALVKVNLVRSTNACALIRHGAIRVAGKVPEITLMKNYLRGRKNFFLNWPTHQPSHMYRTLRSSWHFSATPSDKLTRKSPNTHRRA